MGKTAEEKLADILKALSVADAKSMAASRPMRRAGLVSQGPRLINGWPEHARLPMSPRLFWLRLRSFCSWRLSVPDKFIRRNFAMAAVPKKGIIEIKSAPSSVELTDPDPQGPATQGNRAGIRPAVVAMEREFHRVIRQVEETASPLVVARRYGVPVREVNRLVAIRLRDARRAA